MHTPRLLDGPRLAPASGKPARQLIVLLHGLGADGNDLISLGAELQPAFPEALFISPNAPYPCDMAPYGYQWFSLQRWERQAILEGVQQAAPLLNQALDGLLAELGLEEKQLALIGFSQGTMMALYTALRRATACAGIVGFSGALVGGELLGAEIRSRPPVCLIHGDADTVVPLESSRLAEEQLRAQSIDVQLHRRPGLPHGIDAEGLHLAQAFLQKHLA